jgi:hypothetical protein
MRWRKRRLVAAAMRHRHCFQVQEIQQGTIVYSQVPSNEKLFWITFPTHILIDAHVGSCKDC